MASPHIAGAAAVLKQAQPALTPTQVRQALEATATPVKARRGPRTRRSGRSATATSTSTRPSRSYDAATGAPRSPPPPRPRTRGRSRRTAEGPARRLLDLRRAAGHRRRLGHEDLHGRGAREHREAVRQRGPPVGGHGRRQPVQLHGHGHQPQGHGRRYVDRVADRRLRHLDRTRRPAQAQVARRAPTPSRSSATTRPPTPTPWTATRPWAGWSPLHVAQLAKG